MTFFLSFFAFVGIHLSVLKRQLSRKPLQVFSPATEAPTSVPVEVGENTNFGGNITLNQTVAAPPTGQGITDKATLISWGNTVTTD